MKLPKVCCIYKLMVLFTLLHLSGFARETFGTFKDWDYTPHQVYGQVKLTNTTQRAYYKISQLSPNNIKVEYFNEAGVLSGTRVVTFVNGLLNKVTYANQWGNTYQVQNFKTAGDNEFAVTVTNYGKNYLLPCKEKRFIYKNDLLTEVKYIGFDGRLCNCTNGFAVVKYKRYDDERRFGFLKEEAFFDDEGGPTTNKGWDCHKIVYEQDDHENEIWSAYYNEQGQPVASRYGIHKVAHTYNAGDNELELLLIGINDSVVANVYGVALTKKEYANGLLSKATYYNAAGKIVKAAEAGNGIAITKYEYDKHGNEISQSYFDEKGQIVNNHSGFQRIDYTYSDNNMLLSEAYFDKDSMPVWNTENVHRYNYGRDSKGRETSLSYLGNNDTPVKDRVDVVYMIKYDYDSLQRVASESYWEDDSTKMLRWNGYHGEAYKYNSQGQETECNYFDLDGNPAKSTGGYTKTVTVYNQSCKVSQYLRFNDDRPVAAKKDGVENYHSVTFTYDEKNRVSQINYADTLGHPANAHIGLDKGYDCARIEFVYTGTRVTAEKLYKVNSSYPYKTIDCIENDYINTNGITFGRKNR